ncbi:APC family permease [Ligilactobacillus ceti]|uniref:APC family permease n=1 Tax=Ligilactobacillus ceti TaxID=395085 RepID=UPI0004294FD5|nr:APC family permease [Ligilactobacillus ceti]
MGNSNKKLGFISVYLLGVNGIIGSGIFLLPSKMYALSGIWSVAVIFFCALAALVLTLSYAELASRSTGNGAAWLYAYDQFGEFAGFEVGLFIWLQGVVTISAETAAFLTALKLMVPQLSDPFLYKATGLAIILGLTVVGIMGNQVSKYANNIATVMKIGALITFVIGGLFFIKMMNFSQPVTHSLKDYNSAFNLIFYMFAGFSFLPVAATKMENPKKNLPRILLAVIISVGVIYMITMIVAIGVLGPEIVHNESPLAFAFAEKYGHIGRMIMSIGILGSILGVAISLSYSTPYIASSLAREHQLLPAFFGKITKSGTPWVAVILTTCICALLFLSGDYLFLVPCTVFISLVQYVVTSFAAMKVKKKQKDPKTATDGFNLPLGYTFPILSLLICVYMLMNFTQKVIIFGVTTIVVCVAFYFIYRYFKNKKTKTVAK